MSDTSHIEKLAALSRITLTQEELEGLAEDIEAILGYVEQIQEVSTHTEVGDNGLVHNVMREDGEPHEPGVHSEALLKQAPATKNGFFEVKKVIDQK